MRHWINYCYIASFSFTLGISQCEDVNSPPEIQSYAVITDGTSFLFDAEVSDLQGADDIQAVWGEVYFQDETSPTEIWNLDRLGGFSWSITVPESDSTILESNQGAALLFRFVALDMQGAVGEAWYDQLNSSGPTVDDAYIFCALDESTAEYTWVVQAWVSDLDGVDDVPDAVVHVMNEEQDYEETWTMFHLGNGQWVATIPETTTSYLSCTANLPITFQIVATDSADNEGSYVIYW